MTTFKLKRKAAQVFSFVENKRTRRHYQHQWIKSVNILGDRWLAAPTIERKAQP